MDIFSKFTVSHFIWYLVPGLGAVFFIMLPFVTFAPQIAKNLLQSVGPVGLVLFSIIFGFLMDGLRLYRLKYNYKKIKSDFFNDLQIIVEKEIDPYLIQSNITDMAREKQMTGVNLHHAIWILHGHFSILCLTEGVGWLFFSLYIWFLGDTKYTIFGFLEMNNFGAGLICVILMFLFCVAGFVMLQLEMENPLY